MKALRLAALLLAAAEMPAHADTLVDNIQGESVDREGHVTRFTGIWIDDDGRVKQLLDRKDKRPQRTRFAVDGKGAVVIPGLIDSHLHIMEVGFAALTLDLSDTRSLAEAQAKIRDYAAKYRSEEHTSELQSRRDLVCRLLLEKKKKKKKNKQRMR